MPAPSSGRSDEKEQGPQPALSAVVPCYNEAEGLQVLWQRLSAACQAAVGQAYELILVNDGSTDATWLAMSRLAEQDPRVIAVNLSRNYGHQVALTAGLALCRGQRALAIDADLQDPPELLAAMMARMDETAADVVYGQRKERAGETWFKRFSATQFYRLLRRLGEVPIPPETGDFRLMNRRVVDCLNAMPERSRFLRGMVSWIGLRQVAFPYERQPRFVGKTHYPFAKMARLAVDALTGFSVVPLRLASYIGAAIGSAGLLLLLYVFGAWVLGKTVQGWTSLMVVVLVVGGVQLICLGVFGEYLGRMYMEAKQRPLYIVDRVLNLRPDLPSDR